MAGDAMKARRPGPRERALENVIALQALALREAHNALLDYVERLERQGCVMGYGKVVIRLVQGALVAGEQVGRNPRT